MNMKLILMIITFAMITLKAQTDTIPPSTPQNVQGFGYEKDLAVEWYNNSEPDLAGYKIYSPSGNNYVLSATIPKEKRYHTSTVPIIGITRYYKVSAYDSSGNESPLSDSVSCVSHVMTDEEFLDMVQRATFRYFYDYGDPISGIDRERLAA